MIIFKENKIKMQGIYLLFSLVIVAGLTAASPADHHRHRHHHGKHHKKADENSEPSADSRERTLPPNIWALLATNKRTNDDDTGPKYNDDIDANHAVNEIADNSLDFEQSQDKSIKKVAANCPKCKQNSVKMSENELANLRIEYVKNQILHKLRMTERPAPVSKDELPEPIQEGYAIQNDDDTDYLNRHLDDYYAKTTQKIIFLSNGKFR